MDNKDVDKTRWGQYEVVVPELPEDLVSDCMSIIDNISNRKSDVVNWEERRLLDEATQRSGKYLGLSQEGYDGEEVVNETAGATSEKEEELMSGMGDILREMEKLDE